MLPRFDGDGPSRLAGTVFRSCFSPDGIAIPVWQKLSGASQWPGRFGKRQLYFLGVCRPNRLHRKRMGWDQFCGAHVGRLHGSGQSTGGSHNDNAPLGFLNPAIYALGSPGGQLTTPLSTTSRSAQAAAIRQ